MHIVQKTPWPVESNVKYHDNMESNLIFRMYYVLYWVIIATLNLIRIMLTFKSSGNVKNHSLDWGRNNDKVQLKHFQGQEGQNNDKVQ